MKAVRIHNFGGPEIMKLEQVPDPVPGNSQVLVRVKAAGVNPVETYIRSGIYGQRQFPLTLGTDAAGIVEAVGDNVQNVKKGDRVYTAGSLTGTYAELALCDGQQVHPLPDHLSFSQGAGIGITCGTAWRALFQRGGARAGESVLIHGATGGVGTAAVQLARSAGLTVYATGGSDSGRKLVKELGADQVLDHSHPDYLKELMSVTGGRGVDLILEMLANVNLGHDLEILAKRGRVVVIGSRGKVEIDARNTMSREADVRGMTLMAATPAEQREIHAGLGAQFRNRTLTVIVDKEFPLADAARAHREVMEGKSHGKIVLVPG